MLTSLGTELVAFRPVREKSLTAMLITSFAVSTLLQNAALLIISPRARAVTLPQIFQQSVNIAGTDVPWRNILTILTCLVMLALLTLLLKRTVLGIALRAAADNFRMTRMLGVPPTRSSRLLFASAALWPAWSRSFGSAARPRSHPPLRPAAAGGFRSDGDRRHAQPDRRGGRGFCLCHYDQPVGHLFTAGLLEFREAFMFVFVIMILLSGRKA